MDLRSFDQPVPGIVMPGRQSPDKEESLKHRDVIVDYCIVYLPVTAPSDCRFQRRLIVGYSAVHMPVVVARYSVHHGRAECKHAPIASFMPDAETSRFLSRSSSSKMRIASTGGNANLTRRVMLASPFHFSSFFSSLPSMGASL